MKKLPVEVETVSTETGEVVKVETVSFSIVPPPAGTCAVCGSVHGVYQPHNCQSLYYQYAFRGEHGRWPTWADAVAHCTPMVQAAWERELKGLNAWSAPDEGEPIAQPYALQE